MASLEWVEHLSRKHQTVLELAMQGGPVIPARLCTLYSSIDGVRTALASKRNNLVGLLGQLEGCQEWGVTMRCDEDRLGRSIQPIGGTLDTVAGMWGGAAWILATQAEARLNDAVNRRIDQIVEYVEGVIDPLVVAARELALPPDGPAGEGAPLLLNLAVLLRTSERPAFDAAMKTLGSLYGNVGVTFEMTGPWPSYSFCGEPGMAEGD